MYPPPETPPAENAWAALFLAQDTPVSLAAGQTVSVNLRLKNVGMCAWAPNGDKPIHLGYKWFDAAGHRQLDADDRRTALPAEIAPGEETAFGAVLCAPYTPGRYHLEWDLAIEGTKWFAEKGNPPLGVPVSITDRPRDVSGWRVESNLNPQEVAFALDGDPRTFWDSRMPQARGQWFRLNVSTPRVADGIQFLSPGKGFPASYCLRVAQDGKTFTEIARAAANNTHDLVAVFAPQPIQYAQIDLLGGVGQVASAPQVPPLSYWMISEILVHVGTVWTASASHNGGAAAHAIDNRADTVWSSGSPQEAGMWFQIDLGRVETVSGLMLISPAGENPVGFRIATWNARASRWQVAHENLNNRASVDVAFAATPTQFINIQLLQPSEQPWSIQEARVVREMDTWLGPGGSD